MRWTKAKKRTHTHKSAPTTRWTICNSQMEANICTHLRVAWCSSETLQIFARVQNRVQKSEHADRRTAILILSPVSSVHLLSPLDDSTHSFSLFIWFIIFLLAFTRKIARTKTLRFVCWALTRRKKREKTNYAFSPCTSHFVGWAVAAGSFIWWNIIITIYKNKISSIIFFFSHKRRARGHYALFSCRSPISMHKYIYKRNMFLLRSFSFGPRLERVNK